MKRRPDDYSIMHPMEGQPLLELPVDVCARLTEELPESAGKILGCLRTAGALIEEAIVDDRGLRLAESAAYNVREALDAVVAHRTPAGGGELRAVMDAWDLYMRTASGGSDQDLALEALKAALTAFAAQNVRGSVHASRLLSFIRAQTGVDPLPGLDPRVEYDELRGMANGCLHDEAGLSEAVVLLDRTVAWFIRMFTPPDQVVRGLQDLAAEPWQGPVQLERLRALASTAHHVRLFLATLVDPAWLMPLYTADLIQLPEPNAPWAVAGLLDGLCKTFPASVADVLHRLLADVRESPQGERWRQRFDLLRIAVQLGDVGHPLVESIFSLHPEDRAVRALAVGVLKDADPAAPIVVHVADRVLNGRPLDRERYYYSTVLDSLVTGLTAGNAAGRARLLAIKVRKLASHPDMKFVALDIARFTSDLTDGHDFVSLITHDFAIALSRCRELGVPTSDLRAWVDDIPGEVGERILCRVLAEADDVTLQGKIDHVTERLASSTATGDDKDLIDAVLADEPDETMLAPWRDAWGAPPGAVDEAPGQIPRSWMRAWSWSPVVPASVLSGWDAAIRHVTSVYGRLDLADLDARSAPFEFEGERSPYGVDDLAALPVLDAARRVSQWRLEDASAREFVGARQLARVLETVVKNDIAAWTQDPIAVVTTLREPLYVLNYFQALAEKARLAVGRTRQIIAATRLARDTRWDPVVLGRDGVDFELDWRNVDVMTIELAAALANWDGELSEDLDTMWTWACQSIDLARDNSDDQAPSDDPDTFRRATNSREGRAILALIAFAAWEHRNLKTVRSDFTRMLGDILAAPGRKGHECRAILAYRRAALEVLAPDWLMKNSAVLFGDDELGSVIFDFTLQYAQPTPWLYTHLRDRLVAAAAGGSPRAIKSLLVGVVNDQDGCTIDTVITALQGNDAALAIANDSMAFLAQGCAADDPRLSTAAEFWQALVYADRKVVGAEALHASGRWAFVTGLADDVWSQLTLQILRITGGDINLPAEIADRCQAATAAGFSGRILLLLLGHGDPWDQHFVAQTAVKSLPALAERADPAFQHLRTRLIDLGYHEAADVDPRPMSETE
ncbi:hypothetical protein [Amycolatopsis sp. NPDC059021]|uniref:hypothetical protein n=1 Tax=Amycolatopsis sp. NPDC059021 TaxID=3346704 RepID=UPI0036724EE3